VDDSITRKSSYDELPGGSYSQASAVESVWEIVTGLFCYEQQVSCLASAHLVPHSSKIAF
jgi:hypothetical protein